MGQFRHPGTRRLRPAPAGPQPAQRLYKGKPVAEKWRDKLREVFDRLSSRDKDGYLNGQEVQNIFSDRSHLSSSKRPTRSNPNNRPSLERLDIDKDRSVSFHEYPAYYRVSTETCGLPRPPRPPFAAAATEGISN